MTRKSRKPALSIVCTAKKQKAIDPSKMTDEELNAEYERLTKNKDVKVIEMLLDAGAKADTLEGTLLTTIHAERKLRSYPSQIKELEEERDRLWEFSNKECAFRQLVMGVRELRYAGADHSVEIFDLLVQGLELVAEDIAETFFGQFYPNHDLPDYLGGPNHAAKLKTEAA